MALNIDAVLDRRILRKKLSFWRIIALFILAIGIIAALSASGVFSGLNAKQNHIARVSISGVITEDRDLLKMLKKIENDDTVKGVLLAINSPGGTTVGGEAIFEAVRAIAKKKPVVTSVSALAASAGYMIAAASDHIVARRTSIVGSIGVIFQYPQAHELLNKLGLALKEIKSSPLKAEPSPFHVPPPEAEEVIRELISDSYIWFVDLVTDRRPLSRAQVLVLADGRIYSGDRSLKNKLIDALGGEDVAKNWLIEKKGLNKDLKLVDWAPAKPWNGNPFALSLDRWISGESPLTLQSLKNIDPDSLPAFIPRRLFLDGLLSIWHN